MADVLQVKTKILLTSFTTWLPHQETNSSDELLAAIQKQKYPAANISLFFLRNIPVDIQLASQQVIAEIESIQPDVVICCGMAEKREKLTIESSALCRGQCLYTGINLTELVNKLTVAEISHDAGKFVCEGLYYHALKYIQSKEKNIDCIFVHIPLLEDSYLDLILRDFYSMFSWFRLESSKNIDRH